MQDFAPTWWPMVAWEGVSDMDVPWVGVWLPWRPPKAPYILAIHLGAAAYPTSFIKIQYLR